MTNALRTLGMLILAIPATSFLSVQVSDWKKLEKREYSIEYPDDWEVNQEGVMGTEFFLFATPDSSGDQFKENINLMIQDLKDYDLDLKKYVEISESQVRTMINNPVIVESRTLGSGKDEYHQIVYTGDQGVLKMKWKQHYRIKDKKAYILTFTSEQDTYDRYIETANRMLNSFIIKK